MLTKEEYKENFLSGNRLPTVDEHLSALDDLPEVPDWAQLYSPSTIAMGEFRVDVPYDIGKLREFRALLGSRWLFSGVKQQGTYRVYFYTHIESSVKLEVVLNTGLEGSTCKIVRVGESMTPIYEVQCSHEVPDE